MTELEQVLEKLKTAKYWWEFTPGELNLLANPSQTPNQSRVGVADGEDLK